MSCWSFTRPDSDFVLEEDLIERRLRHTPTGAMLTWFKEDHPLAGDVKQVFVPADHRRQGLGMAMCRAAVRECRKRGLSIPHAPREGSSISDEGLALARAWFREGNQ